MSTRRPIYDCYNRNFARFIERSVHRAKLKLFIVLDYFIYVYIIYIYEYEIETMFQVICIQQAIDKAKWIMHIHFVLLRLCINIIFMIWKKTFTKWCIFENVHRTKTKMNILLYQICGIIKIFHVDICTYKNHLIYKHLYDLYTKRNVVLYDNCVYIYASIFLLIISIII